MIIAIDGLIAELRHIGLPISVSEHIDAVEALRFVDLGDRETVKIAVRSALVKDAEHQSAYDAVFDIYFALSRRQNAEADVGLTADGERRDSEGVYGVGGADRGGIDAVDEAGIHELLIEALRRDERLLLQKIARVYVTRHAGFQPGRAVAGTSYSFHTMRAIGPERVLTRLVEDASNVIGAMSALDHRLLVEDYGRRMTAFRQEVEAEIRRRLVADRGADAVAKTLRQPLPEDIDFLTASAEQVAALRGIVAPMGRKLAAMLAHKRRNQSRGALDFRRTVRQAMSTGGIPIDIVLRRPQPSKPELLVLADISGSGSAFAAFTLQLTYALRSEFNRVRSFVFVDGIDEVTDIMQSANTIADVTKQINAEGRGVWLDGRSDYGNALDSFWQQHRLALKSRTTVLVLGDARTNYHSSRATVFKHMSRRAGHVFWLNPEPESIWNSGDSVIAEYAKYCDGVYECRNVRQLRTFIEQLN
jgi:uncharacterized protein with von Willebrand factor type A (vWA) domain